MHSVADGSQRDLIWPLGHKYGVWKCLVSPNCTFESSERVGTMVKLELYVLLVVCSLNIRTILPGVLRHAVLVSPYPPPTGLQKMSLLPHIICLDVPCLKDKQAVQEVFSIGSTLDAVKVIRVETERGLVLKVQNDILGYVHVRTVADMS